MRTIGLDRSFDGFCVLRRPSIALQKRYKTGEFMLYHHSSSHYDPTVFSLDLFVPYIGSLSRHIVGSTRKSPPIRHNLHILPLPPCPITPPSSPSMPLRE